MGTKMIMGGSRGGKKSGLRWKLDKGTGKIAEPLEHEIQKAVFDALGMYEGRFVEFKAIHAVPNGADTVRFKVWDKVNRKMIWVSPKKDELKAEGLKPGILDIHCPFSNGEYCGLYVEMKRGKNDLSESQREMKPVLEALGNKCVVCRSSQEALEEIRQYCVERYEWLSVSKPEYRAQAARMRGVIF